MPVNRLLGDLERAVMEVVWSRGAVTVRDVQDALTPRRALAYTTVMTVMARLADKGILHRRRRGRAFVYRAAQPDAARFVRHQVRSRIRALLADFGPLAVAGFVDEVSHSDPDRLAELARIIEDRAEAAHDA
jgi:predicted transcriptional regulator